MRLIKHKHGFFWVTLWLFLFSLVGHWVFGWYAFVAEAHSHGEPARTGPYLIKLLRDTFENWQSEFLQLIWQVAGLAYLLHVGSPQSKEGSARAEAKLDYLLSRVEGGDKRRIEIDRLFQRRT